MSPYEINFFFIPDGACSFQENSEKQISVDEDTPPGTELFIVRAYPRRLFKIQAEDGVCIKIDMIVDGVSITLSYNDPEWSLSVL